MDESLNTLIDLSKQFIELCDKEFADPYIQEYAGADYRCRFCHTTFQEGHDEKNYDCPVPEYNRLSDLIKLSLFKYGINY